MKFLLLRIYSVWCAFWFVLSFLLLYPFFFLFLQNKNWYPAAHQCNRIWGWCTYFFSCIPYRPTMLFKRPKGQHYVYCANHTSYLDIPTIYLSIPGEFSFIGKASLNKVPLFGYMYKRLHITVDRKSRDSKLETMERAIAMLKAGKSVAVFPEGTIPKENTPHMLDFKEGAFKMAIQTGTPILPVALPDNWKRLPDNGKWMMTPGPCRAIFFEPINTRGMTEADIPALKARVYEMLQTEINKQNKL